MKKLTLVFAAMLLFSFAFSQINIGMAVGTTINSFKTNNYTGDGSPVVKPVILPTVQFQTEFKLTATVSINSGFGLIIRGTQTNFSKLNKINQWALTNHYNSGALPIYDERGYSRIHLNYLELPVNVHFSLKGVSFLGGVSISHFIGGRYKSDYTYGIADGYGPLPGYTFTRKNDDRIKPGSSEKSGEIKFRPWDFGIQFGTRVQVYKHLHASAEYYIGLNNVLPDYELNSSTTVKSINQQFNRGLSVKLIYISI